jgi:uncharacterized membrane protein YkvA (DUF1232 family)
MGSITGMRRMGGHLSSRDLVKSLPQLAKLAWRVVRDDRIPMWIRGGLLGTAAYLVLPFDVVPDWIPVLGQMDDLLVVTIGVRTLLRRVPEEILAEHWNGDPELLARILGHEIAEEGPTGPTRT